jgi:hypothetical protein
VAGTELQQSEGFTDVRQLVIERHLTMSAHDYIGHLSTVSAYVMVPPADRDQVFHQILRILPETVEVNAEITAHLARRHHWHDAPRPPPNSTTRPSSAATGIASPPTWRPQAKR